MQALPWVLLGKRVAYQPDLDTSAAMLAFGRSPLLPGQLLGHPGPPLTSLQTKALLEEMYKLDTNPSHPTSTKTQFKDISSTDDVTHVYVRVDEPKGLSSRFEGPYKVISRPSRSQVEVRVGSYANGQPRTSIFHWSSCKPAHLREDFQEGSRPNLGRPRTRPDPPVVKTQLTDAQSDVNKLPSAAAQSDVNKLPSAVRTSNHNNGGGGKIQTSNFETLSGNAPHPDYLAKGPLITRDMFDKWAPDMLGPPSAARPVRSTRNPSPNYVGSLTYT